MGNNFGQSLTALLTGLAQGHGEAAQDDKIKKQKEKLAADERLFKIAGVFANDTTASPEMRRIGLAAAAGDKDALKQLKEGLGTGAVTVPTPGKTGPALPNAAPELPAIDINKEGKLARDQVLPEIASPPPPTQEARDRQVITEPGTEEIPLFRDPREIAKEQGELAAIGKEDLMIQALEFAEKDRDLVQKRKVEQEDKLIAESVGRAEEILGKLQDTKDINQSQMSVIIGQLKDGIPFSTAMQTAGVDLKSGQTIANKFAAIEKAIGSKLSASEKKRFLGIESIADPASRLITSRVGNTLVGTVWDPSTNKFKTHILKEFATPRKAINELDIDAAHVALEEVMGENQWAGMDFAQRQLVTENYIRSLQLGRTPVFSRPVQVNESFWGSFAAATTRPSFVEPPLEDDPDSEADRFDENNPR